MSDHRRTMFDDPGSTYFERTSLPDRDPTQSYEWIVGPAERRRRRKGLVPGQSKRQNLGQTGRRRRAVFSRDGFTCRDCLLAFGHPEPYGGESIEGLTLGHIIPRSKGGTFAVSNLIAQCQPCNELLDDRLWVPGWWMDDPRHPGPYLREVFYEAIVEEIATDMRVRGAEQQAEWDAARRESNWSTLLRLYDDESFGTETSTEGEN